MREPRGVPEALVASAGLVRLLVASTCAASAGVHAALTADHLRESVVLGVAFALSAGALTAAALAVRDPRFDRWAPLAGGCVLALTAVAYALSRTTGIPLLVPDPEPVDPLGMTTFAAELCAALAATSLIPRKVRP